jgi:hypothetical protein
MKERASEEQRLEFSTKQMKFFVVRDKSRRVRRQGAFYASASPTQSFPLWGTDKTVFKEFRLPHNFTPTCITTDEQYLYLFTKQVCFL